MLLTPSVTLTPAAVMAQAVLIPPPLFQHLTFPLLSVTLLVSFGSSMLYGYNLAVVNSPAVVKDGQHLWEQRKGSASHPGRVEGLLPSSPTSECLIFPLGSCPQTAAQGEGQYGRDMGACGHVLIPDWSPLKAGTGEIYPQPPCFSSNSACGMSKLSLKLSEAG